MIFFFFSPDPHSFAGIIVRPGISRNNRNNCTPRNIQYPGIIVCEGIIVLEYLLHTSTEKDRQIGICFLYVFFIYALRFALRKFAWWFFLQSFERSLAHTCVFTWMHMTLILMICFGKSA